MCAAIVGSPGLAPISRTGLTPCPARVACRFAEVVDLIRSRFLSLANRSEVSLLWPAYCWAKAAF